MTRLAFNEFSTVLNVELHCACDGLGFHDLSSLNSKILNEALASSALLAE